MYEELKQEIMSAYEKIANEFQDKISGSLITLKVDADTYITRCKRKDNHHLTMDDLIVVDSEGKGLDGDNKEPDFRFFVDLKVMNEFQWMKCMVHSTCKYSYMWAQTGVGLPPLTIAHAMNYWGEIPVTAPILYSRNDDLVEYISEEVLEILRHRNPQKCRSLFARKMDAMIWGEQLDDTIELVGTLETLSENGWHVSTECDGCMEYLPYALVDDIYHLYN